MYLHQTKCPNSSKEQTKERKEGICKGYRNSNGALYNDCAFCTSYKKYVKEAFN